MILDYYYNQYKRKLEVSYIEDDGQKRMLMFDISKFKTFYRTPNGPYENWDGSKCDIKYTEKPSTFDIKTFFKEMDPKYQALINKRTFPKLYTCDIETKIADDGSFPEASEASQPITTISICSPNLNTIVLGTRKLSDAEKKLLDEQYADYLDKTEFFHTLGIKSPTVKYLYFETEREMLEYFLKYIVAKVSILAGWNFIQFDWQYIVNRIKNYYPDLSIKLSSCTYRVSQSRFTNKKNDEIYLPIPDHTIILDLMEVIENEDKTVLPIKESMSLDYIASSTPGLGVHKIKYKGSLQDLYNTDYEMYVFYNAIDSVLTQLIERRYKALDHIYLYSLYTTEKIEKCFSKIALTEALVFKNFYERGLKVVFDDKERPDRGHLVGAYVKVPIPGIHEYVCCNDFASLYPSTIRTTNISFENFVGSFYDYEKLKPYASNPQYVVIGPNVYLNDGTISKPTIGPFVTQFLLEDKLEPYRKDKNYFVSVNGCVYKNDKDYTFRLVQGQLKAQRDKDKYMSKLLDATVLLDIEHIQKKKKVSSTYDDSIVDHLASMGYNIKGSADLISMDQEQLIEFKRILKDEISYLSANEQAMKLLMNSMYGGCSHVSFYWFNIDLANDITGESRNLIHMMENHIPTFWRDNWLKMTDLHKMLGIKVDPVAAAKALEESPMLPDGIEPDAFHGHSFVVPVYGDTDSLYMSYQPLLKSIIGYDQMTLAEKRDIVAALNTKFMDQHNKEFIAEYYKTRFGKSVHNFELETIARSGVWLDVKKRYAQILMWKDGKVFDIDDLPMKVKGLELVKSSYPSLSRSQLKEMVRFLLENSSDRYLIQKLNILVQKKRQEWMDADLESICGSKGINGYTKYIIDDTGEALITAPKCPVGPRAMGNYNRIRNYYKLPGEPLYSGKMKWYMFRPSPTSKEIDYFAFQSMDYPEWAKQYAPPDRNFMFQQFVLDPFNRIINSNGFPKLALDGSIQTSLF